MDQFFARCHRIGQADHVHVDVFTSDTKLDKAIRRIARDKASGHTTLLNQEADA
jgi:SNF2 family DNA or RNA helicase